MDDGRKDFDRGARELAGPVALSGLAAIFGAAGGTDAAGDLGRMLAAQGHRGPDGCRGRCLEGAALGHLHFRTTPEEAEEAQPLESGGGRLLLAFDGRLDNRGEIWRALPGFPGPLSSLSDAALVLAAFETWGEACFARFLGPFAIAVLDARAEAPQLLLARDPLGSRPLAFWRQGDLFLAASEELGILAHPRVEARLCEERLALYFSLRELVDGKTFFRGIEQVLPGHGLRVGAGGLAPFRFWTPQVSSSSAARTDDDLAEEFRSLLSQSVAHRMRGTRPPAVLMSGGLDSTPIAALASRHLRPAERLQTLTWTFDEHPDCDERFYVEAMARDLPLECSYLPCDDAWPLAGGDAWPMHPTTPEQNPYRLFHQRAYRAARGLGARTMLSGMTGDQLYSGTDGWLYDLLLRGRLRAAAGEVASHLAKGLRRRLLRGWVPSGWSVRSRHAVPAWLTPEALRQLPEASSWPPEAHRFRRPQQALRLYELMNGHGFAVESFFAGSEGVELRYPLRDLRLIELLLGVPTEQLYRRGSQRPILRRAFAGQLPEAILRRQDKATFAPIFFRGLAQQEARRVDEILNDAPSLWPSFVRREWLEAARRRATLPESAWVVLWFCVSAELWHRSFKDAIFACSPPENTLAHETPLRCGMPPGRRTTGL